MKKYIIPGVLIVFSGVLIYQIYSLTIIKEELKSIKNMNTSLQTEVNSLSSNLSGQIQSTLYEEFGKSYLTKDVIFKLNKNTDKGYYLTLRAELSEIKENNSKVLFMYKPIKAKKWNELELENIGELSYVGDFNLSYDDNYEYKIVIKGNKTESSDVQELSKSLFAPELPEMSWQYDDDGIYFNAIPNSDEELSSENKIKTIEVIVNGEKKTYKCKYREEPTYDSNNEIIDKYKYYEVNIPKEDYNKNINSIKAKITYEDGTFIIEDVTNKKNQQ
ncbi:hypothetical protein [Romboutsia sp. MSSM.1001216sp_RTP31141st1_G3_RTP31141_220114]|uniref:hypothetical protein n=1 Tax=unclassified Romboutsia TaxID=2626894 RepID=UPI0031B63EF5